MARVLITGGAGYVGSHVAKALALAGHEGLVFDNLRAGHKDFVRWGGLIQGDIRDSAALDVALNTTGIDAIMHFAALAYVGESVANPSVYYDNNVHGTSVLLDAMVRHGISKFVLSSSCAVYGVPSEIPIRETTPLGPINPYGVTKAVCEQMLLDFEKAYGVKSVRLRYFNAAGADQDCEIGEDHSPETHLIPLALYAATGRTDSIEVFGTNYETPDGTAIRDYVHVSDLARAHVLALEHLLGGGQSVALNLASGHGASVRQVVQMVQNVTHSKLNVRYRERRPGDPPILIADATLAYELLGWSAARSDLETMIADAWRWQRLRHGDRPPFR